MLEEAGFVNSAADYTDWVYPEDRSVELMPEVLFFDEAIGADAVHNSVIYNTTPAYANGKYFSYDLWHGFLQEKLPEAMEYLAALAAVKE